MILTSLLRNVIQPTEDIWEISSINKCNHCCSHINWKFWILYSAWYGFASLPKKTTTIPTFAYRLRGRGTRDAFRSLHTIFVMIPSGSLASRLVSEVFITHVYKCVSPTSINAHWTPIKLHLMYPSLNATEMHRPPLQRLLLHANGWWRQ